MRETEFRGLRTDGQGWVYGYLLTDRDKELYYITEGIGACAIEVIHYSVGQFTGLLDKNGFKIFEGDKTNPEEEESKNIVRWDDENAMFVLDIYGWDYYIGEGSQEVYDNECSLVEIMNFGDISMEHIEIIGNIHENQ